MAATDRRLFGPRAAVRVPARVRTAPLPAASLARMSVKVAFLAVTFLTAAPEDRARIQAMTARGDWEAAAEAAVALTVTDAAGWSDVAQAAALFRKSPPREVLRAAWEKRRESLPPVWRDLGTLTILTGTGSLADAVSAAEQMILPESDHPARPLLSNALAVLTDALVDAGADRAVDRLGRRWTTNLGVPDAARWRKARARLGFPATAADEAFLRGDWPTFLRAASPGDPRISAVRRAAGKASDGMAPPGTDEWMDAVFADSPEALARLVRMAPPSAGPARQVRDRITGKRILAEGGTAALALWQSGLRARALLDLGWTESSRGAVASAPASVRRELALLALEIAARRLDAPAFDALRRRAAADLADEDAEETADAWRLFLDAGLDPRGAAARAEAFLRRHPRSARRSSLPGRDEVLP